MPTTANVGLAKLSEAQKQQISLCQAAVRRAVLAAAPRAAAIIRRGRFSLQPTGKAGGPPPSFSEFEGAKVSAAALTGANGALSFLGCNATAALSPLLAELSGAKKDKGASFPSPPPVTSATSGSQNAALSSPLVSFVGGDGGLWELLDAAEDAALEAVGDAADEYGLRGVVTCRFDWHVVSEEFSGVDSNRSEKVDDETLANHTAPLYCDKSHTVVEAAADMASMFAVSAQQTSADASIAEKEGGGGGAIGAGRPLFIGMHGGGGCPAEVNDSQWENHTHLYSHGPIKSGATLPRGAVWVAPRSPVDAWNMWWLDHMDAVLQALAWLFVAAGADSAGVHDGNKGGGKAATSTRGPLPPRIDPSRVHLTGYSAGGDGAYQLGQRCADRLAGLMACAGHPNGAPLDNLRNTFTVFACGANDGAYGRNAVTAEYLQRLSTLQQGDAAAAADPSSATAYPHAGEVAVGFGHWMGRREAHYFGAMAAARRAANHTIVGKRFEWLLVPSLCPSLSQSALASTAGEDESEVPMVVADGCVVRATITVVAAPEGNGLVTRVRLEFTYPAAAASAPLGGITVLLSPLLTDWLLPVVVEWLEFAEASPTAGPPMPAAVAGTPPPIAAGAPRPRAAQPLRSAVISFPPVAAAEEAALGSNTTQALINDGSANSSGLVSATAAASLDVLQTFGRAVYVARPSSFLSV